MTARRRRSPRPVPDHLSLSRRDTNMSTNSNGGFERGRRAESEWARELAGFAGPTPLWLDRSPGRLRVAGPRVSYTSAVAPVAAVQAVAEQHAISPRTIYSAAW